MKPAGDFEWVREFDKLFFIFALGIDGLLDSGGWVLGRVVFNSTDSQATLSLASQIQKENSIDSLITVFKFFFAKMLLKPRFCKQHHKDLEQNPLAQTSMAYRSTSQPLDFIVNFNGKYLLILWSCHSISITFFGRIRINGDVRLQLCVNNV